MTNRNVGAGTVAVALFCAIRTLPGRSASWQNATNEEIDAAVKFYESVKADPDKLKTYCDVRQAIGMMASGQGKFAEAQQKASAATKQLGPEFGKAQSLQTRLDMKSEDTTRYTAARQGLAQNCQ
jgi:hypothetical protein